MGTKLLAVFLALHGLAHAPGFTAGWKLTQPEDMVYTTTVLWGNVDLGDVGIRIQALFWLPGIALFVLAAYALFNHRAWAIRMLAIASAYSLVICLINMPNAVVGLVINVLLLAGIAFVQVVKPWLAATR